MEDNHQIINIAPSSSSSVMPLKKYDVFLSFRGEDTRDNFTSHLYDALKKDVGTYIDYRLEKGDEISQALIKAIQDSHVSVVIFSENYASSKWCLDEISVILQCKRDHGQIVIPVFYNVDPSDVRKQRGSYKGAFAKHEQDLNNSDDDKLQKWRRSLTEAANLAGWDSRNRNESDFIKDIVKDVLQKLNITYPVDQLKGVVGIQENYAGIESLLELGSTEVVRVIGIWGMGGIGKTTLARALYDKLSIQFEGHCFLKSVREQSEKNGIDALRKQLFSDLLGGENLQVESHYVMRRLARKKVLIVLDDVATSKQLEEVFITDYYCLAPGSRVIVTTRDKHIICQVNGIYEVKGLNYHDSLHLFCLNAFKEKCPENGYEELSECVIAYCKGSPLALKVLGARLRSKSIDIWQSELRKLRKILDVNIHNILKLNFDGLDHTEQNIFLDIACFLKGESRNHITSVLDACDFHAVVGIANLIDKSLITLSNEDTIEMHDLIQEMGWEIVRQESIKNPGRRSRLWCPEEVCDVLKNKKGSEAVECIVLDVSKMNKDLHLSFDSFTKMTEVRIIKFFSSEWDNGGYKIYLHNGLESLSDKLRYLDWHGYCLQSFPSTFCAEMLVDLRMQNSSLKKLWDGAQNLVNLKEIDLTCSKDLVELPDLTHATNLEVLHLKKCISLREVHPSVLSLHKLWSLDLKECTKIECLESEVHSKSLCKIYLSKCSSLKKFSVFSEKLEELWLDDTVIQELPSLIWRCEKLEFLSLSGCDNLECFGIGSKSSHGPVNASLWFLDICGCKLVNESDLGLILDGMRSLRWLHLEDCCNLRALPDSIGSLTSLEMLNLCGSINVEMLSPNIKNLLKLKWLVLDKCKKLVCLPELPPSLELLIVINCLELRALPDSIGSLTSLWKLDLSGCINVEMLSPNIKNLLKLEVLRLDNCTKLVSLPELPPSLEELHASNCTSLQTDFTQLLPVLNGDDYAYVILPGSQVPDMFMFGGEGDSITFPQLANSRNICGFICCLVFPYPPGGYRGFVKCRINKHSTKIEIGLFDHTSISDDHLLLFSIPIDWFDSSAIPIDIFDSLACDPNSITFEFEYEKVRSSLTNMIEIKGCGVIPVYASQDQQRTIPMPTEHCGSMRKAPSFKKEESSRPEKHIIPFDTPSASNNNLNQTIEVSQGKDLSNNQVDNCSEHLFLKSHTLMEIDNPDWDPIGEVDSILSDSCKVSPLSTHSTCISEPHVKAILAKLETLLETSLEIISSNDEVKQQFHHVLEQLCQFEAEVPVKLHPVICKLKTLIEGFDFRFATSQKTIQDYDQLLQSRSLLAKQLGSVKVQQDQIKAKVTELKMQIENINSEIGEQEKESSVLDEVRERLKRELDHYDAESRKLKIQAAQWVPECKNIITALKNSETAYKVAVTKKKKYEDEWAQLKNNFAANKF